MEVQRSSICWPTPWVKEQPVSWESCLALFFSGLPWQHNLSYSSPLTLTKQNAFMLVGSLRACSVHTFSIPLQELPGSHIPLSPCKGWCSECQTLCLSRVSDLPHCLLFPILLLLRADSFVRSSIFFLHSWIHHIPPARGPVLSLCPPGFLLRGRSSRHDLPFASALRVYPSLYWGAEQGSCVMTSFQWKQSFAL